MENSFGAMRSMGFYMQPFEYGSHTDNVGVEWRKWLRSFEALTRASRVECEEWKADLLLHYAGPEVQQLYETLPSLPDAEKRGPLLNISSYIPNMSKYEEVTEKLNSFFLPKQNTSYERHLLRQIKQKSDESIDSFTTRLYVQAERCGFGDKIEENIRDQIIENCQSAALRRELLKRGDTGLTEILKVAKIFETVAQQEKSFQSTMDEKSSSVEVNKIKAMSNKNRFNSANVRQAVCNRCGFMGHLGNDEKCPARGKMCLKCGGKDHFARKCRKRPARQTFPEKNGKYEKRSGSEESARNTIKNISVDDSEYVFNVTGDNDRSEMECRIGGVNAWAIIDSGSKYNLMSEVSWTQLKKRGVAASNQRRETGKVFRAYGGHELIQLGAFSAELEMNGQKRVVDFYVVRGEGKILIGRETASAIGVLKIISMINLAITEPIPEPFGKIKDVKIDIPIRADARPVIQPYRRIPVALEKIVDDQIGELLQQGIIEKVNGPSKWISPIVVVPKGDGVRICVDMRRANEAVERENHPLPTIEDFLPHLAKAKVFSKLDVKNAFHQVEISEQSRHITTFITRKGLFRYTRLMFGISCAPELFQKLMERILIECDGCFNFIDDILIFGENITEHDERLTKVLKVLKANGVVLNEKKCVYGATEVKFLGHTLSSRGIEADDDKLEAIRNFREPKSSEEVRSFLGLVNYVAKFIPDLATTTEPLRQLTKQKQKFVWKEGQSKAFRKIKQHMMSTSALGYFNANDRTQVVADASPVGLGAVLIQFNNNEPRIISYASRSLSEVEKRYAQTEKEALALVWAIERFHFYLYGRSFELITDHKPLELLFRPKSRPCMRMERWTLRLQAYKVNVVYRPGKTNIADPLSRLAVNGRIESKTLEKVTEEYIHWVVLSAAPVAIKITEIEKSSKASEEIQAVKRGLDDGDWSALTIPFKPFATELCFAGVILLRGTRIVMPEDLRNQTLDLAHEGHPGMTLMKQRLRAKVWWPKMDAHVETYVKNCRGCILVAAPAAPEPMNRRKLPSGPWRHLAVDYLGPLPSGHNLFVVVDYYSRFVEIEVMTKTDTFETIKRLEVIFTRFGFPISITADNGPQFTSEEFRQYCKARSIELNNTTPYWPQMNGVVERQNRSILKRLSISQSIGSDWLADLNKYLQMYRSTPHTTTQKSPSEMLFGWNIRDKLPSIQEPKQVDEETADRDKEMKEKGKLYANKRRNAKEIDIGKGDKVLLKRTLKANKLSSNFAPDLFTVVDRHGGEVIVVSDDSGKKYRRNVSHLQKVIDPEPALTSTNGGNNEDGSRDVPRNGSNADKPRTGRLARIPAYLKDFEM